MNETWKKAGVIIVVSVIIFLIFKPKKDGEKGLFSSKKRESIKKPTLDEQGMQDEEVVTAYTALCAYIDAYNDGVDETALQAMKADFKEKMGLTIYEDGNKKLAVKDLNGDDILVNS